MTQTNEALVERIEAATPSRWIACLAALGTFFLFILVSVFLHSQGFDRLEEITTRAGFIAAALTWWEIRRPKDVAKLLRAKDHPHA